MLLILAACSKKESTQGFHSAKKQINPFYEKAVAFMDKDPDSAFYFLNKGKELFQKRKDSYGLGKSFVNMAVIQENAGDNFGSIETSLLASKFLKENDTSQHSSIFSNYNNLGVSSNNLKNYKDAKGFYDKAILFTKDPVDKLMLANNIAVVYHNEKNYAKAVDIYTKLLDSVGAKSEFYPRLLLNFSRSKWFADRHYKPVKNYLLAESLSHNFDDDWTKDAAYAYLSAYYLSKNVDSVRYYASKMLFLATKLRYPEDQLEALQNLIKISDGSQAQSYFEQYSKIQDSLKNSQNKAKNQFALIRYETEKSKAENLKLQKEHADHEHQVEIQKLTIGILLLSFFIAVIVSFFWIRRRRQKLIFEANTKLQAQRLDFSKKVHDVVANGIYEVMTTIENQNDLPKEKLLDKLELMYHKSRDLSYEKNRSNDFSERMTGLIVSFDSESTQIIMIGNDPIFWDAGHPHNKEEFFHIIRELLVNMKKHSHATQVILRFIANLNNQEIKYIDNGVGLPENFVEKNGLLNMRARLALINADLEIEERHSGLKLSIKTTENVQ
ncbi:tetratricopeptide repeat-containing sensor histidine kinase [Epilithonimonas tenax]|uniref:tetratricopeptide repeat-containing sensor histidine kinase n=1 Tax=Epilithonimonas tenax TaxID=191577 RepID=UPI0006841427|nr:tetratricopeptide repeat protein [Epilithonimonas tenax]